MVKYPVTFSRGETGLAYQYFPYQDREMGCLIIQNFWCDDSFAWRARGGSKKIDVIPDVIDTFSYQDYFVIQTPSKFLFYYKDDLRLELEYGGNFSIGSLSARTSTSATSGGNEVDSFEVGFYVKSNITAGTYTAVSGNIRIPGLATYVFANRMLVSIGATTITPVENPDILRDKQFISNILYLNQKIYLSMAAGGIQRLEFNGGSTESTFSYRLAGAFQYKKVVKYNRGFVLVGTKSSEVFTTSDNSMSSIFTAGNIKAFELCIGNIEYIACDDTFVVYSFVDIRDIYISVIGTNHSTTYSRIHNEIAKIKGIETISGRPQKFMILYDDGIIDVLYCLNGASGVKVINSRLKFYGRVDQLISGYAGKLFFRIGSVFQYLAFESENYLDNWTENIVRGGSLTPVESFNIYPDNPIQNYYTADATPYIINRTYDLPSQVNSLGRVIIKQTFRILNRTNWSDNARNATINIRTTNIVSATKILYIDLDFDIILNSTKWNSAPGTIRMIIMINGQEVNVLQ